MNFIVRPQQAGILPRTTLADVLDLAEKSAKLSSMPHPEPAFTYADLFAGIGGFHAMLDHAGGHCVYVSEIDTEARQTYLRNWVDPLPEALRPQINSDINLDTPEDEPVKVPKHDVLAGGFPCQPFSKSGYQRGMDEARGTLFWNIARILQEQTPSVVLLENVRNITGPRHRHEWETIIQTLRESGYRVSSTPSVFSPHLLPPELGGTPQVRDRVFILGTYVGVERALTETDVPPTVVKAPVAGWDVHEWDVNWVLDAEADIENGSKYRLNSVETHWINVWDDLVQRMWSQTGKKLPGFPLWSDDWVPLRDLDGDDLHQMPLWKSQILIKNARFFDDNEQLINSWRKAHPELVDFPASRRKLEWQAQDNKSLWDTVMHFRPSGIRAKAPTYLPALVAITQTSIVGPRRRRITPNEAARLQGLPRQFSFAGQRDQASYKQVGNGVAVGAAWHVFKEHILQNIEDIPSALTDSVTAAGGNPSDAITADLAYRSMSTPDTPVLASY